MAKNTSKTTQMSEKLDETVKQLEIYKELAENAKAVTQPSVVLKGGVEEIQLTRLTPKDMETMLWSHPVVPRGVEIKANRMTGRGYRIEAYDDSPDAKEAADRMLQLFTESGDETLINGWIQNALAFGNGYFTLLPDSDSGEIVRLNPEHPIFFRIARYPKDDKNTNKNIDVYLSKGDWGTDWGAMKIDPQTKKPMKYTQVVYKDDKTTIQPIGDELDDSQVAHLVFDTWGDEAEGISVLQYIWLDIKYLLNIEEAGAEAIYRSGFTQKKVTTNIKTEKDLKKIARNLKDINGADAMILPEGTDVQNLVPGNSDFVSFHDKFLTLVAIRLGVPKPILTLDGTTVNKATMQQLMKDMLFDIRADELKVKRAVEEQVFIPACHSIFGNDFDKYPKFFFNEFVEGKEDRANVMKTISETVSKLSETYIKLLQAGQEDAAKKVLGMLQAAIPPSYEDAIEVIEMNEVKNESVDRGNAENQPTPEVPIPKNGDSSNGDNPKERSGVPSET